jgi:hypothetical protein
MDQLISQITQRTGISEQQARQAVRVVADFLEQRLPEPVASQVDNVLSGKSAGGIRRSSGGYIEQIKQGLGEVLGSDQP